MLYIFIEAIFAFFAFMACFTFLLYWLFKNLNFNSKIAKEPLLIAALVAAYTSWSVALVTTVGTMVTGKISASYQKEAEMEKTKANILLSIFQQYDSSMVPQRNENNQKERMKVMIQSGIIPDEDGSICLALIKDDCPIQVLKKTP